MKTTQDVVEEQMKFLQGNYPEVFGQKMSMIVKSTLMTVAKQAEEHGEKKGFEKGYNLAVKHSIENADLMIQQGYDSEIGSLKMLIVYLKRLKIFNSKE